MDSQVRDRGVGAIFGSMSKERFVGIVELDALELTEGIFLFIWLPIVERSSVSRTISSIEAFVITTSFHSRGLPFFWNRGVIS